MVRDEVAVSADMKDGRGGLETEGSEVIPASGWGNRWTGGGVGGYLQMDGTLEESAFSHTGGGRPVSWVEIAFVASLFFEFC